MIYSCSDLILQNKNRNYERNIMQALWLQLTWEVMESKGQRSGTPLSITLTWAHAEDHAIFKLVMHWSCAAVLSTQAATVQLYASRDTFEFDQEHVTKNQPITVFVLLSESLVIWSGGHDQESTNHSVRFVEWKSRYITTTFINW